MKKSILRVEKVPDMVVEMLVHDYNIYSYTDISELEFNKISNEIEIILASGESKVTASLMEKLPNLKLISVFGVGYDGVDIETAKQKNINVSHTPNVLTDDVADLGMALLLATSRKIIGAQRFIEQGYWGKTSYPLTTKVSGGKLGIAGFGRVGQAVAKRAEAFNMQISYFDRSPISNISFKYYSDLAELAKDNEFLIVCLTGGKSTNHLINRQILHALGKQGILINIARGGVVNEKDLVNAINNNEIAGAGLDVFENEPDIPKDLLYKDNVVLSPHLGSATYATRKEMSTLVVKNINSFLSGKGLITPIPELAI
ncbi:2-hydroxyacid dehydrogenase [Lonepinella sp. BR2271]|uniref:2-hydroxyacid dehydrogenase n=1 Tax=Lonepinella sp. BR2271 TaxID=3434550 RepID=UPI003F6E2AA4